MSGNTRQDFGDLESVFPETTRSASRKVSWTLGALLVAAEAVTVFVSGYICALAYQAAVSPVPAMPDAGVDFLMVAVRASIIGALLAPLVLPQDWTDRDTRSATVFVGITFLQVAVLLGLVLAIGVLTQTWAYVPRAWVVSWAVTIFAAVGGVRLLLLSVSGGSLLRGVIRERIAIVGEPSAATAVASRLRRAHGRDIDIVGVSPRPDGPGAPQAGDPGKDILGIVELGKTQPLDKVVLAAPGWDTERVGRAVSQLKALDVAIALYPGAAVGAHCTCDLSAGGGVPMTTLVTRPIGQAGLAAKAVLDRTVSAIVLLWIVPLLAVIALLIKLDSPGPVYFRQRRHGLNNAEFEVIKFRTMTWTGGANATGAQQAQRKDARVTRVGRFLRRSSLDEVPQLINVIRGEMSLVGPRPHPTAMRTEDRLCEEIVAEYPHRHRVKPGITGWAQINGHRGATSTAEQVRQRVEHDLFYIENWSLLFDLKILALTPVRMILDNENAF